MSMDRGIDLALLVHNCIDPCIVTEDAHRVDSAELITWGEWREDCSLDCIIRQVHSCHSWQAKSIAKVGRTFPTCIYEAPKFQLALNNKSPNLLCTLT